jgi:branched-subunit amino acid transport protein AzlD
MEIGTDQIQIVETQVDITEVETQTAVVTHTDATLVGTNVKKSPSTHNVMIVEMTVRFLSNRMVVSLYVVAIVSVEAMITTIVHHSTVKNVIHSIVLGTIIDQSNQNQSKTLAQPSRKRLSRSTINWNAFSNFSNESQ